MGGWESLIAAYAPRPPASVGGGGKVTPEFIVSGLVERGVPQHVAEGFAMNVADESGFDPGINEVNPVVKGSRGGFGLYQLTGPRREAYEAFAAERGVDPSDPNAQLDFAVLEFAGPENRAYRRALATSSPGEAAAVIVTDFLRPAQEHRDRRVAKYIGGQTAGGADPAPKPNRLWLDLVLTNG